MQILLTWRSATGWHSQRGVWPDTCSALVHAIDVHGATFATAQRVR